MVKDIPSINDVHDQSEKEKASQVKQSVVNILYERGEFIKLSQLKITLHIINQLKQCTQLQPY